MGKHGWLNKFVVIIVMLNVANLKCKDVNDISYGPQNDGLKMSLSIQARDDKGINKFLVKVVIRNFSDTPITLIANRLGDSEYGDFIKDEISFSTFPDIAPSRGQVKLNARTGKAATVTIKPNSMFITAWESKNSRLKTEYSLIGNPEFRYPGLYGIRAQLVLQTQSQSKIFLYSNEEFVPIGGSYGLPKHTTAKIIEINQQDETALINLGLLNKIENGDEFIVIGSKSMKWELKVIEAYSFSSLVKVIKRGNVEVTPPLGAVAVLVDK